MVAVYATPAARSLKDWVVKRGVLYFLTQTPMIALMVGYFFRWTTVPIATAFTVIFAFAVLPAWILYRKDRSDDPDEPVHHLHKYALYALVPYAVYNLARVPMHYLLQIVFWDHWYDFGAELTGEPVDQWSSLIPGTFLHSLQGYVLALGFYILYQRHSLVNALAYVFVFLSVIYTWSFPTYVLVDYQPPAKWFFVVWWAHFWMGLAAWYMPKLYAPAFWRRFRTRLSKATMIGLMVALYMTPFTFVFWRVATWQFPYQRQIDEATFQQAKLILQEGPVLTQVRLDPARPDVAEARYAFKLRFGPRIYRDYINAQKAIDAGPIVVTGRLFQEGKIIAWCSNYVSEIETPNTILNPLEYFPALQRMEYTDIPVACVGPAEAFEEFASGARTRQVDLEWQANVQLIGDRERKDTVFEELLSAIELGIADEVYEGMAQASGQ